MYVRTAWYYDVCVLTVSALHDEYSVRCVSLLVRATVSCPRRQDAYASTKEEEDRANAKRRDAIAAEGAVKTANTASDYKTWRGGDK